MDHIREAVTKARGKRIGGPQQAGLLSRSGQPDRRAPENDDDLQAVSVVNCNVNAFAENCIISNEHDPVLNSYRVLRTRVLQKMEAEGWRTVAVVSPSPSAGKTVTAINLAIAVGSSKGSRVALADFDFYRPSVSRYLGIDDPGSVLDYFEGQQTPDKVMRRTDIRNLLLFGNERVSRRGAEFFSSPKVEHLFDTALNGFRSRIVVMDTSPILGCDDTIALLPEVDCVLLVAASGHTKAEELKEVKRLLRNTNIVGTVLNMAPASSVSGNYYYA